MAIKTDKNRNLEPYSDIFTDISNTNVVIEAI